MVVSGVLLDEESAARLKKLGVKDSKLLTPKRREKLFGEIVGHALRYKIVVVPPSEVDSALESDDLNLNWLEANKFAEIINELGPDRAVVDCPSNNCAAFRRYLVKLLIKKNIELVIEHKADVNHVECSAASILAKVTRDAEIEKIKKEIGIDFGSGYAADPRTVAFLKENADRFPGIFRTSWGPHKKAVASRGQSTLEKFR